MSALEQIVLWWFLNATWELSVCFACCWLFLRFVPNLKPSTRHLMWLVTLTLAFLAPFGTLLGLWGDSKAMNSRFGLAVAARMKGSGATHLPLLIFFAPALYRAYLLLRGAVVANRVKRQATAVDAGVLESALPKDLLLDVKRYRAGIFLAEPTTSEYGPFTCGVKRPFILIPANLFLPSSRQMLISVVAHEVAHIQRCDMLLHLSSEIMLLPLAFHPFSYSLRSRIAEAREMACDARVSGAVLPPTDYARCLLDVAETLSDSASPLHALGISESATLEHRIQALVTFFPASRQLCAWAKSFLVLAALAMFVVLLSAGRKTFLWMSAVPEPQIGQQMLRVPPPPPPPPLPNRR